jgi:molybdopterin-synthase adenylyltransferase
MNELTFVTEDFEKLRTDLTSTEHERCAVMFAEQIVRADGTVRLLVNEITYPEQHEYTKSGVAEAELSPAVVAAAVKKAKISKRSLIFAHSHPGNSHPRFSATDSAGEARLLKLMQLRHPDLMHGALVVSIGGVRARTLGEQSEIRVTKIGRKREVVFDPHEDDNSPQNKFDRQIRAFGADGQRVLQQLRVSVVGLGGIGSIVTQQLAHLGVQNFDLFDPDHLEETNLNRVVNSTAADLGKPKVEIAARYIRALSPNALVNPIIGDVIKTAVAKRLVDSDVIFACTDSHGSRAIVQQMAYQYYIPCIDTGTTINVQDGVVSHIYGRVELLSPGLPCLHCSHLLDSRQIRVDMMSAYERKQDPYVVGAHEPAPAVVSINGTVASMAVNMFLGLVTAIPLDARYVLVDFVGAKLRTPRHAREPNCFICSGVGALGKGDSWPLMGRED